MSKQLTIQIALLEASRFGGRCLSTEYSNIDSKLLWLCQNGHSFEKSLYDVKNRNRWCNKCEKTNLHESYCRCIFESLLKTPFVKTRSVLPKHYELDGYSEPLRLAFEYHGEQHYKHVPKFKNSPAEILRRKKIDNLKKKICRQMGISLIVIPYTRAINKSALLSYVKSQLEQHKIVYHDVNINWGESMPALSRLENARKLALAHGGACLSTDYDNVHAKMQWECNNGHKWEAQLSSIRSQRTWCPFCIGQVVTIEDIKNLAKKLGGELISSSYQGAFKKLQWLCQNGHIWSATPDRIKQGSWCPKCTLPKKNNIKHSLETFQRIASARGGRCLSDKYINSHANLLFQCQNGHAWTAKPYNILHRKTWCRKCLGVSRRRIDLTCL